MFSLFSILSVVIWLLANFVSSHEKKDDTPVVTVFAAAESNFNGRALFVSGKDGLDSPKVNPINASTYDWWYFDVVSKDQGYSAVVVFFNAPATAFPLTGADASDITEAQLFVSTPENATFFSSAILASEARVTSVGNGARGDWIGSGFSFKGDQELEEYVVAIDSPQIATKGKISMKSSAPAHYPCDPVKPGVTMEIMPHVGWSNAILDGVAQVELEINGTKIEFNGRGYHDKNWGDQPFDAAVGTWYWGHGHLGPYSIVWYDALALDGSRYVSAYVSRHGKVITGTCAIPSITVRPTGPTNTYPPPSTSAASGNFHIEIDLGGEGMMTLDLASKYYTVAVGVYDRWTGELTGGIKGKESYTGTALYEQFSFL